MNNPWNQQQQRQKEWRDKAGYQWWKEQQGPQGEPPQRHQGKGCGYRAGQVIAWMVFIGVCLLVIIFIVNAQ